MNSSQTGNCPGCRFSFPSTFSLWAELRQRASSGKTDPTQSMTCLNSSSNCAVLKIRRGSYVPMCTLCCMYSASKRMCVVSFSHVFLSALSLSTVHRTDSRKNTPCFDLILHDMCLHYSLSLQARGSFTAECLCRVFTSKMQSCSILTCLENVCFSLNILYADLSL